MRLAWFSPVPPVQTGIAAGSADLVEVLRRRGYTVDLYPPERAHDFPWRHRQAPYDLIVFQFGNSSHHDYQWAYALRYPGLVVLHDTQLHHARAAFLLREHRADHYRAEFRHPDVPADAAELAVAGLDLRLFYEWAWCEGCSMNRTGFVGGLIPREDGAHATTEQVFPRAARARGPNGVRPCPPSVAMGATIRSVAGKLGCTGGSPPPMGAPGGA